jgi:hypothetical protein
MPVPNGLGHRIAVTFQFQRNVLQEHILLVELHDALGQSLVGRLVRMLDGELGAALSAIRLDSAGLLVGVNQQPRDAALGALEPARDFHVEQALIEHLSGLACLFIQLGRLAVLDDDGPRRRRRLNFLPGKSRCQQAYQVTLEPAL